MVKPKTFIERHYTKLPPVPNSKMEHYTCKYCVSEYAYHSTRMIGHLLVCQGCPSAIKHQASAIKNDMSRKGHKTRVSTLLSTVNSSEDSREETADQEFSNKEQPNNEN